MTDTLVTVAKYPNELEAQLAKNHLESEGIAAVISESVANNWFPVFGEGVVPVKLDVADGDLSKARTILQEIDRTKAAQPSESNLADLTGPKGWTMCSGCGSEVSLAFAKCPSCAALIDQLDVQDHQDSSGSPLTTTEPADGEDHSQRKENLVDRAWRASLLGLLVPILVFYSLWLLWSFVLSPEAEEEADWAKFIGALAIDVIYLGLLAMLPVLFLG